MRRSFELVLLLGVSVCLIGCSTGNKRITEESCTKRIITGETTKAEVTEILGKPWMVSEHTVEGKTKEMWFYQYHKDNTTFLDLVLFGVLGPVNAKSDMHSFQVHFSEDGIVESITQSKMSL